MTLLNRRNLIYMKFAGAKVFEKFKISMLLFSLKEVPAFVVCRIYKAYSEVRFFVRAGSKLKQVSVGRFIQESFISRDWRV